MYLCGLYLHVNGLVCKGEDAEGVVPTVAAAGGMPTKRKLQYIDHEAKLKSE